MKNLLRILCFLFLFFSYSFLYSAAIEINVEDVDSTIASYESNRISKNYEILEFSHFKTIDYTNLNYKSFPYIEPFNTDLFGEKIHIYTLNGRFFYNYAAPTSYPSFKVAYLKGYQTTYGPSYAGKVIEKEITTTLHFCNKSTRSYFGRPYEAYDLFITTDDNPTLDSACKIENSSYSIKDYKISNKELPYYNKTYSDIKEMCRYWFGVTDMPYDKIYFDDVYGCLYNAKSNNEACPEGTLIDFYNSKNCKPLCSEGQTYNSNTGKCEFSCEEGTYKTSTGCTTNCDLIENRKTRFDCMCNTRGLGGYKDSDIKFKRYGVCILEPGKDTCEGDIIPNSFYGTITCENGVINKEKLVEEGKSVEEISNLFGTDDVEGGTGGNAEGGGTGGGGTGGGGGTEGGGGGTEGGTEGGETPDQPDLPDKPDDPEFCTDELRDEVINRYADYVYNNVTHGVDCSDYTKTNWADKQREEIQKLINKYNSQCPGKAYNKIAINYKCKADPTQPENPENPEQPENPENPGQPVDPTNPTNPSVDPTNPSSEGDNNATITDPDNKEYCTAQNTLNMLQLATDVPRSAAPGITATINAFNERCGKKLVVKIKDDEGTGTGEEGKEEGEGECEGENCSFNGNDIAIGDSSKFDVDGSIGDSLDSFTSGYDEYLNKAEDAVGEAFEMYDKLGESYNNFNSTLENLTSGNPFVSRSVNSCVVDFELYNKVYHFDVCKYLSPYGDLVYMLLFIFLNLVLFIGALKLMVWIISSI